MTNTNDIIDIEPEVIAATPEAEKPPVKKRGGMIGMLIAGLLASAIGGGWLYRDVLSNYIPSDQVTTMVARIDALEATTKTLNEKVEAAIGFNDEMKSNLAAAQLAATDVAQLKSDSADFKSKIENLKTALGSATKTLETLKSSIVAGSNTTTPADISRIENLEKDIASLKQSGSTSTDTALLSQSLSDLKAKVAAGVSYQNEFDRIKALVPAADGLEVLQAQASNGIANAETLASQLQNFKFTASEPTPITADDSWWNYAGSLVSSIVTIKSAGTSDWQTLSTQVAEIAKQGDLVSALATLEKAEGALPLDLQAWKEKAANRLAVEQALEKTSAAVLRQIAAKG